MQLKNEWFVCCLMGLKDNYQVTGPIRVNEDYVVSHVNYNQELIDNKQKSNDWTFTSCYKAGETYEECSVCFPLFHAH